MSFEIRWETGSLSNMPPGVPHSNEKLEAIYLTDDWWWEGSSSTDWWEGSPSKVLLIPNAVAQIHHPLTNSMVYFIHYNCLLFLVLPCLLQQLIFWSSNGFAYIFFTWNAHHALCVAESTVQKQHATWIHEQSYPNLLTDSQQAFCMSGNRGIPHLVAACSLHYTYRSVKLPYHW